MAYINVTGEVDYMHNWKDVANDDVLVSVAYLHRPNHCLSYERRNAGSEMLFWRIYSR